jgi:anthranilate phosphoribosyltransferase
MGAALALEVAGVAATTVEGLTRAAAAIDDGHATALLRAIAEFGTRTPA